MPYLMMRAVGVEVQPDLEAVLAAVLDPSGGVARRKRDVLMPSLMMQTVRMGGKEKVEGAPIPFLMMRAVVIEVQADLEAVLAAILDPNGVCAGRVLDCVCSSEDGGEGRVGGVRGGQGHVRLVEGQPDDDGQGERHRALPGDAAQHG